jgi:RNA polymerase sigma factor (sigma-70 family)
MIGKALETGSFDDAYLARLRQGDDETARHFDRFFRRMLSAKVWGRFGPEREEDLVDGVMTAAMEKILRGEPRNAACLMAYISRICSNLLAKAIRTQPNGTRMDLDKEQISDRAETCEERLLAEERAEEVRRVLSALGRRDRGVLVDLFCHEFTRGEVCEKYGVTRQQLRLILFHARERFRKRWLGT